MAQIRWLEWNEALLKMKTALADAAAEFDAAFPPGDDPADCPVCSAGLGVKMGILGERTWFRCRSCGTDWSRERTPE